MYNSTGQSGQRRNRLKILTPAKIYTVTLGSTKSCISKPQNKVNHIKIIKWKLCYSETNSLSTCEIKSLPLPPFLFLELLISLQGLLKIISKQHINGTVKIITIFMILGDQSNFFFTLSLRSYKSTVTVEILSCLY